MNEILLCNFFFRLDEQIQAIKEKLVGSVEKELDACRRQIEDNKKMIAKAKVTAKNSER
jgi:hypothetical protein